MSFIEWWSRGGSRRLSYLASVSPDDFCPSCRWLPSCLPARCWRSRLVVTNSSRLVVGLPRCPCLDAPGCFRPDVAEWDTPAMDSWGEPLYGDPCRECAFQWATGLAPATSLMRDLPDSVDELVTGATGTERLPELAWNVSAYVAHMTDNTRIWAERLISVARGADTHVCPYDPDLLAQARRYNDIGLKGAKWSLRIAVESWLSAVAEADRAGVVIQHSERGVMEVSEIAVSNAHDSYHHCWDLTRLLHRS
jgi:hypothetical protein